MAARARTIDEILREGTEVDRAAREGVRRALLRHKLLGESIAVWRDGKMVEIPPDQIQVDDSPDDCTHSGPTPPEAA